MPRVELARGHTFHHDGQSFSAERLAVIVERERGRFNAHAGVRAGVRDRHLHIAAEVAVEYCLRRAIFEYAALRPLDANKRVGEHADAPLLPLHDLRARSNRLEVFGQVLKRLMFHNLQL